MIAAIGANSMAAFFEFHRHMAARTLVGIPDRKLALFENGKVVRIDRVAVGKTSTPSPAGKFKIVRRRQHTAMIGPL